MMKFVEVEMDTDYDQFDQDKLRMWAAAVPGGVLCFLTSTPPKCKMSVPEGRTLTFVPNVKLARGPVDHLLVAL